MKRTWSAALFVACIVISLRLEARAQSPLVLAKDLSGTITRVNLSLGLRSSATTCDQTQAAFPDDSRMISDGFALNANNNGFGTFYGTVRIVSPAGQILQIGTMRGTVGLNTRRDPNQPCRQPWHLEGIFEPVPTFAAVDAPQIMLANFSADLIAEAAGPLPVYRARLDGLVSVPAAVKLVPDKLNYGEREVVTAMITNGLDRPVTGLDLKSYCSIVHLQKEQNGQWVNTAFCPLRRVALPTTINAGETMRIALAPSAMTPGPNATGLYRLAFTYKPGPTNDGTAETVVTSARFRIDRLPVRGNVAVSTDKGLYATGERLNVQVTNDAEQPIRTEDHKTDCSIVHLQRLDGANWKNVAECPLASPTREVTINSHQTLLFKLPADPFATVYEPGVYRLELGHFLLDAGGRAVGQRLNIYSAQFAIVRKQ